MVPSQICVTQNRLAWQLAYVSNGYVCKNYISHGSVAKRNAIRVRQRNCIGHIIRGNSLLRTALEGKMEGKKNKREPKDQDA